MSFTTFPADWILYRFEFNPLNILQNCNQVLSAAAVHPYLSQTAVFLSAQPQPTDKGAGKIKDVKHLCSFFIGTEVALRIPMTYDNHPIHPSIPSVHPQSLFNHLNKPWIDLSRPPMTSYQST